MITCEHKFVFGGNVYTTSKYNLPGSGAKATCYYQEYFCEKCLEKRHNRLNHTSNNYHKPDYNAAPILEKDLRDQK